MYYLWLGWLICIIPGPLLTKVQYSICQNIHLHLCISLRRPWPCTRPTIRWISCRGGWVGLVFVARRSISSDAMQNNIAAVLINIIVHYIVRDEWMCSHFSALFFPFFRQDKGFVSASDAVRELGVPMLSTSGSTLS